MPQCFCRLPLCLRRRCRGTLAYWEPAVVVEAMVSITSGMLLWMGFWDALEIVLPADWYWRLAMIGVGTVGLFATRTMYDKSMLAAVRKHSERDNTMMLSAMEMASCDRSNGGKAGLTQCDVTGPAHCDGAQGKDSGSGCSSTRAVGVGGASSGETSAAADDDADSSAKSRPRPFLDAPRPDARRCCRAVFAILVGLTLWVGLWDLVDYTVLPAMFAGANGSSVCEAAEGDPGPHQIVLAPACLAVKLMLMVCGVTGMWVTRSLYGSVQVHSAQFSRFQ